MLVADGQRLPDGAGRGGAKRVGFRGGRRPSVDPCRVHRHPGDTYVADERVDEDDSRMTGSGAECAAIAFVTQPPDLTSEAQPWRLG